MPETLQYCNTNSVTKQTTNNKKLTARHCLLSESGKSNPHSRTSTTFYFNIIFLTYLEGDRGSAVVKVLCYKSE